MQPFSVFSHDAWIFESYRDKRGCGSTSLKEDELQLGQHTRYSPEINWLMKSSIHFLQKPLRHLLHSLGSIITFLQRQQSNRVLCYLSDSEFWAGASFIWSCLRVIFLVRIIALPPFPSTCIGTYLGSSGASSLNDLERSCDSSFPEDLGVSFLTPVSGACCPLV